MSWLQRANRRIFDDASPNLDRFGILLFITIVTICMESLVDQADRSELRFSVAASLLTLLVGTMFLLAARASGVSSAATRFIDAIVGVGMITAIFVVIVDAIQSGPSPYDLRHPVPSLFWTLLAILMPFFVVRRLLVQRHVRIGTVLGAITAYLLIAIAYHFVFQWVDLIEATPFFGEPVRSTTFMYFSLVTITTLGYGDLTAVTDLGRLLATSEAVIGQVFLVTFVALIVGLLGERISWGSLPGGPDDRGPAWLEPEDPEDLSEEPGRDADRQP